MYDKIPFSVKNHHHPWNVWNFIVHLYILSFVFLVFILYSFSHSIVGVLLFSGMCVIGTSVYAAGLFVKGPVENMFAVMLVGRLLFGYVD